MGDVISYIILSEFYYFCFYRCSFGIYIYIYAARHGMDSNLWMLGVKIGKEDINSQDWKREI